MNFETLNDFIHMGGHGPYVWTSYGVGLVVIIYNVIAPMVRRKEVIKRLNRNMKRESSSS